MNSSNPWNSSPVGLGFKKKRIAENVLGLSSLFVAHGIRGQKIKLQMKWSCLVGSANILGDTRPGKLSHNYGKSPC